MSRRNSRADLILKGARERVQKAEYAVNQINTQLDMANATLSAHMEALEQLEKDLAPTVRKVKEGKSTAPPAKSRSSRKPGAAISTPSIKTSKDVVGGVERLPDVPDDFLKPKVRFCVAPNCGLTEGALIHDPAGPEFDHVFLAGSKAQKATAGSQNVS